MPTTQRIMSSSASYSRDNSSDTSNGRTLRLAVFDLDYTVWDPEMYQLSGRPRLLKAPKNLSAVEVKETRTTTEGMIMADKSGTPMRVFAGASHALADIEKKKQSGHDIQAAVASRTDEPEWAYECMENLAVQIHDDKEDGRLVTLLDCFGGGKKKNPLIQISFGDKSHHFKRLHAATKIPYEDMVFFDNENWNIRTVSKLGVKCIYTPDGMQKRHWDEAKKFFGMME